MAVTTSKVTYSLKPETVDRVQELATTWGVPKSEVIRRAVEGVNSNKHFAVKLTPGEALRELQTRAGITKVQARKFSEEVRLSRRASGRNRG